MVKEIGSHFFLKTAEIEKMKQKTSVLDKSKHTEYLSTGRQAIEYCLFDSIVDGLKSKKVLLPAYTCYSVIQPFIKLGFDISYYDCNDSFQVYLSELNKIISKENPSVVYLLPYFGFNTIVQDEQLDNQSRIIILDSTHCHFSKHQLIKADYIITSLRKWGPLPDGAVARKISGNFLIQPPKLSDINLIQNMVVAYQVKDRYINHQIGNKEEYLAFFKRAEDIIRQNNEIFRMSSLSVNSWNCLYSNQENLTNSRRNNFFKLQSYSKWHYFGIPLFSLSENDVPLFFPLLVPKDRNLLQTLLAQANIFCPIVWPNPYNQDTYKVSPIINRLRNEILCIPIDQRYTIEDMTIVIDALDGLLDGPTWKK